MRDSHSYLARHFGGKTAFGLLAFTALFAAVSFAGPSTLDVKGNVNKPGTWTIAQLQHMGAVQTLTTKLKGQNYTVRGISLWDVINAADPKFDPAEKHPEARFVVLAVGRDGYISSFSLSELTPAIGNTSPLVVWEANGKPLPPAEGAFRLVVPEDKKPMRWTYELSSIEIYDGKRLQPHTVILMPETAKSK